MTANPFDPDAIMREVRAVVGRSPPATTATLLQKEAQCSKVAIVAGRFGSKIHEASIIERSNIANVATTPLPTDAIEKSGRSAHRPADVSAVLHRRRARIRPP